MSKLMNKKIFKLRLNKLKLTTRSNKSSSCSETIVPDRSNLKLFKIQPQLYLSNYKSTKDLGLLKTHKIDHVINLTAHKSENYHPKSITYSSFKFADNANFDLKANLDEVITLMTNKINEQKTILIHCQMGISRAPSVVIAFLMKTKNMDYETAFKHVESKNSEICPNIGFLFQLQSL